MTALGRRKERPIRRLPTEMAAVWIATAVFGLLLFMYSVAVPLFRGPDEGSHIGLLLGVRSALGYPSPSEQENSERLRRAGELVKFDATTPVPLSAGDAQPRATRPTLRELGPETGPGRPNRLVRNPPLYYSVMGSLLSLTAVSLPWIHGWPFDATLGLGRLINGLLVLPLPVITFFAARRIPLSTPAAAVAALLPLTIPQLLHVGSVYNNDNLLILFGALHTTALIEIARGRLSQGHAVAVGLLGGLVMLTKAFGLLLPPSAVLVYGAAGWRLRDRRAIWAGATSLLVAMVAGGWWWVRNLVTLGVLEPSSASSREAPPGFDADLGFWLARFGAWMIERFWGWFGWFDVRLPLPVVAVATGAAVAALAIGAARIARKKDESLALLAATLVPFVALILAVGTQTYDLYAQSGETSAIHGRYLFGALVGPMVVVAAAFERRSRLAAVATLALAVGLHLAAARGLLETYWGRGSASSLATQLKGMSAWAPWPTPVLGAAAVALGAGAVGLMWSSWRVVKEAPR